MKVVFTWVRNEEVDKNKQTWGVFDASKHTGQLNMVIK